MKLEHVKNVVTSKIGRQILIGQKNSPTILFAAGVVGLVGSTVLACRATLKLEDILEDAETARDEVPHFYAEGYSEKKFAQAHARIGKRTTLQVVKLYTPSVVVGVVSVAALTGSHITLSRRNAAVMAAYSALDKGFNEYRTRVRDEYGEEKDLEFRHGSETRTEMLMDKNGDAKKVEHSVAPLGQPSIYARFFDDQSTQWKREADYNRVFLNCQQSYANDLLRSRGHLFLNEIYDSLGLSRSKAGAVVGWVLSKDGDNFVDFGLFDNDSQSRRFVNGNEYSVLLDFNVDGVIYDLIEDK